MTLSKAALKRGTDRWTLSMPCCACLFQHSPCLSSLPPSLQVVKCVVKAFADLETPPALKVARLSLVSDIFHNCSARVRNASRFRLLFQSQLDEIFSQLHRTFRAITGRLRAEQFRVRQEGRGALKPLEGRWPTG